MEPRMLSKIRCTLAQKMALIDYMWDHRQLARYEYDPYTAEVEWLRLAETLNQTGSVKTVEKWKITWRDLKRKALREVQKAVENNKNASEAALKIQEIMREPDDGIPKKLRNLKMSPSPSHPVFNEESYQGLELEETIDQDQSQEYLEPNEVQVSPSGLELEAVECTPDFSSDSSYSISPSPRLLTTKSRSNQEQINTLVDCMAMNTGMAFGNQTIPKKREDWMRLRQLLNRIGPAKQTAAWQHSWRDLKRNALERNKISTKSNTPLTKKIVEIVAAYNEGRHANDESADGDAQLRLPPQVKHLIQPDKMHNAPSSQDGQSAANTVTTVNLVPLRQSRQRFKPKTRSTNIQICALVDYMEKHPALAIAKSVAGDTQCPYVAEWRRLSLYLNRIDNAKRSTLAWKRTWRDLKNAAKKAPNNDRNSYLNKRILEIIERAPTAQNNTEFNKETEDVLPFSADFDQVSEQLSLGQHSDRSSPVQSENRGSQPDLKLIAVKKTRCTNAQKHALVDYMSTHPALATSRFIEALDSDPHYAEWRQLSKYLNKIGTAKTTVSWKRTWRDLKSSVLKKKWSDETLLGIDRRILDICEDDLTDFNNEIAFDCLPDPSKGMPVLYLQSPEHTTQPDIILCDQNRFQVDPANQKAQNSSNRKDTMQESPGRQSEMSPRRQSLDEMSLGQRSSEMSPDQRSFGTESPVQRSEQESLAHSENEKTLKRVFKMKTRVRCTKPQINALVNYMSRHPDLARARCLFNTGAQQDSKYEEWSRLCRYLNKIDRSVSPKSVSKWKHTWRTLETNARRKDRKKSKWNDLISRKILQTLNENDAMSKGKSESQVEDLATESTEDYVELPSPSSELISLQDPLKSEQEEDLEQNQPDRNTPTKRRTNIRRSSSLQLRALADYMIAHPELALNHSKLNPRTPAWARITRHLNNIGPARSSDAWRQTWKDLKLRVSSRSRLKKTSNTLQGFREKRIMKLIGLPSSSHLPDTDCETVEEYNTKPEPAVPLAPRAVSPRSVLYNFAEILARKSPNDRSECERRNDNTSQTAEIACATNVTNNILRELVQELKRSNELKAEQNVYLKELLTQLKIPSNTHERQDTDVTLADSQTDIQKQDVDTQYEGHSSEVNEDPCIDEIPTERAPVIRPVALSSLTTIHSPAELKRVKVQSILQPDPKNVTRRLVRLKDGTMVLLPSIMKTQMNTNQDNNDDQLYVVCGNKRR